MLKILELLIECESVLSHEILDFKEGKKFYYIKVVANLINQTKIYLTEFNSSKEFNYSYWQDQHGALIHRWDNAPHFKSINTFPHHRHDPKGIFEYEHKGFKKILEKIEEEIKV